MKKIFLFIPLTAIVFSCSDKNKNERRKILTQIVAYGDSITIEQERMQMLINSIDASTPDAGKRLSLFLEKIDERTAINKRIYKFQWKIDSLLMKLKK